MIWIVAALVVMPLALLAAYFVVIQYERGGWWRLLIIPGVPVLVADAILAHALFPLLVLDYPRRGEWTFSDHLARLVSYPCWRGAVARYLKRVLDAIAPSGLHIKPKQ